MKYIDLHRPVPVRLRGIGDVPSEENFKAQKNVRRVAHHRGCIRDEHDRFMPTWFNNMNMPVNIRD